MVALVPIRNRARVNKRVSEQQPMTFPYFETPESPHSRSNSLPGQDRSETPANFSGGVSSVASSASLTPVDGAEHQFVKDRMRAAEQVIATLQSSVYWVRIARDPLIRETVQAWRAAAAVYENYVTGNQ